jgi:2-dehydro-3-deoxy-D-arabinonate dehydratase
VSPGVWRLLVDGRAVLARGDSERGPAQLLDPALTITSLLGAVTLDELPPVGPVPSGAQVIAPVDGQPVWAAGVTFRRSRDARKEEAADGGDLYDRVFSAERPELFFKAAAESVIGPDGPLGIRADSTWSVPEPEVGVVAGPDGRPRALVLGNDVSSRSIEGDNPLYLPQAKVYERSCGLGPCLVPLTAAPAWDQLRITITIRRADAVLYRDAMSTATIHRAPAELLSWLFTANSFPRGVVLLTGTSLIPPPDITLHAHDTVTIHADGLGTLHNPITTIGRQPSPNPERSDRRSRELDPPRTAVAVGNWTPCQLWIVPAIQARLPHGCGLLVDAAAAAVGWRAGPQRVAAASPIGVSTSQSGSRRVSGRACTGRRSACRSRTVLSRRAATARRAGGRHHPGSCPGRGPDSARLVRPRPDRRGSRTRYACRTARPAHHSFGDA